MPREQTFQRAVLERELIHTQIDSVSPRVSVRRRDLAPLAATLNKVAKRGVAARGDDGLTLPRRVRAVSPTPSVDRRGKRQRHPRPVEIGRLLPRWCRI